MDLQERQEEALDSKDKSKSLKEKNIKENEIKNNDINNLQFQESAEKNKEDKVNIPDINNNNDKEKNSNNEVLNENNKIDEEINRKKSQKSIPKDINNINKINDIEKKSNIVEEEKNPEDPLISYIASNRKISDEIIQNSSKLILEEIEGNLFNEKKIEINAGGMVGGRNKKDGFTIFGQNPEKGSNNDMFIPDFELNISNNNSNNNFLYPYIFSIYYKIEDKNYYIRSYSGKGSDNKILFIKLRNKNKYIIKQKELISAGSIIFQITPINDNELEIINLTKECDFSFPKDKSFSRYQTCFEFDESKNEWSIIDGKDKDSTNGTWIFGTHSFLIKDEMFIEVLNSKINIKEITK